MPGLDGISLFGPLLQAVPASLTAVLELLFSSLTFGEPSGLAEAAAAGGAVTAQGSVAPPRCATILPLPTIFANIFGTSSSRFGLGRTAVLRDHSSPLYYICEHIRYLYL